MRARTQRSQVASSAKRHLAWVAITVAALVAAVIAMRHSVEVDVPPVIWLPSPPDDVPGTRARSTPDGEALDWVLHSIVVVDGDPIDAVCVPRESATHTVLQRLGLAGAHPSVFYKPAGGDAVVNGRRWRRYTFQFK